MTWVLGGSDCGEMEIFRDTNRDKDERTKERTILAKVMDMNYFWVNDVAADWDTVKVVSYDTLVSVIYQCLSLWSFSLLSFTRLCLCCCFMGGGGDNNNNNNNTRIKNTPNTTVLSITSKYYLILLLHRHIITWALLTVEKWRGPHCVGTKL
jgi:hypothetical protein